MLRQPYRALITEARYMSAATNGTFETYIVFFTIIAPDQMAFDGDFDAFVLHHMAGCHAFL
jgi:hypothetical protein